MTVKEFVDEYKKLDEENKIEYVKNIININYVSYSIKITDCNNIINSTSYTSTEPNLFKINSPARNMLYLLNLVNRYTEIDVNFKDSLAEYDLLKECNAFSDILNNIPEEEMIEYTELLQVCADDFMKNERSLIGYLDTKFETLKLAFNTLAEANMNIETGDEDIEN